MKISAHVLVKNESRFIWYSVMSVINYVDRIRIWDTGSTDGTLDIIDSVSKTNEAKKKEIFEIKKTSDKDFSEEKVRQAMLSQDLNNGADWILIVDGDEVWWEDSIKKVTDTIKARNGSIESIVVPTYNLVGDMYHYQESVAGRYNLAGHTGHLALRAINCKIPGLTSHGEHGVFAWYATPQGKRIEERDQSKIVFVDAPYLHTTHLKRSDLDNSVFKRTKKYKYEIGEEFSKDFYYPEVFFRDRPKKVPSVWNTLDLKFKFRAFFETPMRKIYRRTYLKNKTHGY